ncbi:hypothetical protein PQQ96_24210 [Paraburkholderia sediminicola]|uniref:hypothetical protein n=1 Tax=Paraburkholderia sediminicola TaxID=458836 RepID=UPI0038BDEED3
MGQAKIKRGAAFAPYLIDGWESRDCIDFAFALSRLTGWLLHVDWWTPATQRPPEGKEDGFKPLRVFVGDNRNLIFDPRGVMSIFDFRDRIVTKQIRMRGHDGPGSVLTRFYGEDKFVRLPLRYQPDAEKIKDAVEAISAHPNYLSNVPARGLPKLPAHHAARFSFGSCSVFAEALSQRTGLRATALMAIRLLSGWEGTEISESGYFHSVVLHPDGMAEDSWGKAAVEDIALRYGVAEFVTNDFEHRAVVERIKHNTADVYALRFDDAVSLIRESTGR